MNTKDCAKRITESKIKLQDQILSLLSNFSTDTGLMVSLIDIGLYDMPGIGEHGKSHIYTGVTCHLNL